LSENRACEQYYSLFCQSTESCSGAAGLNALGFDSVEACTESLKQIACAGTTPFCHSEGNYDEDYAQACLSGMKTKTCSDPLPSPCDGLCSPRGGPRYSDACRAQAAAYCERSYACGGQAQLDYLGWSSVAECTTGNQTKCATMDYCGAGQRFSPDGALRCAADLKEDSCGIFPLEQPYSCEERVCVKD
jgi:hypothetical protein